VSAEQAARKTIDELLGKAGWRVCDLKDADLHASRGVAIREFPLEPPSPARVGEGRGEGGYADYLLYVDGKAAGVVEAKKVGATLTGVEVQSGRYAPQNLADVRNSQAVHATGFDSSWSPVRRPLAPFHARVGWAG